MRGVSIKYLRIPDEVRSGSHQTAGAILFVCAHVMRCVSVVVWERVMRCTVLPGH